MNNPNGSESRFGKENATGARYRWSRCEIVTAAAALLKREGSRGRREIVRTTLELHRLLAGES